MAKADQLGTSTIYILASKLFEQNNSLVSDKVGDDKVSRASLRVGCWGVSNKDIFILVLIILELWSVRDDLLLRILGLFISLFFLVLQSLVFLLLLLLFVLGLLQTDEVLTIDLVELLLDIVNNLIDSGDKDELERIHTTISHLEGRVQSNELCLQRCDCNQNLEEFSELFSGGVDGLTTTRETEKGVFLTLLIFSLQVEDWQVDSGNVLGLDGESYQGSILNLTND